MKSKKEELLAFLLDNSVWFILIVFFVLNAFLTPYFFTVLNFRNILIHSSILGIVVIGESLCLLSGHFDLSVESTLALSAIVGVILIKGGISVPVSIILMLLSGMLVGLANGVLIRKLGLNAFVATLITYIGIRGTALGIVEGKTIWNLPSSFCFFWSRHYILFSRTNNSTYSFVCNFSFFACKYSFWTTRLSRRR